MRTVKRNSGSRVCFALSASPTSTSRWTASRPPRYQINVADVQDAIQTAVGGNALTQVLQGEQRYDLVMRYLPQFRNTQRGHREYPPAGAHRRTRFARAALQYPGWRTALPKSIAKANQRYVAIKYSVRGRDLGGAVEEAIKKVDAAGQLPPGYHIDWAGEYESQQRAQKRLAHHHPSDAAADFLDPLFDVQIDEMGVADSGQRRHGAHRRHAGAVSHGTNLSVSSGVGFLALFGVSVQVGVIMVEYINQLRARGHTIVDAAMEGAVLRLRPIMMTMLVATLGLLPAATSHGIGSDSQRPFAIVIVGGLDGLFMSIFLLPTLYVWMAGEHDILPALEADFEEHG